MSIDQFLLWLIAGTLVDGTTVGSAQRQGQWKTGSRKVDGAWSSWGSWLQCSTTCGQGFTRRLRVCNNPRTRYGGKPCEGHREEQDICNEDLPCPVNCNWLSWSRWSGCSEAKDGKETRHRNYSIPLHGGKSCCDINMETEERMCPVDGNWLSWSLWSGCSDARDLNETRHRNCSTPLHGGKNCSTTNFESEERICPVDGNWLSWSLWSGCSDARDLNETRHRNCSKPLHGGKSCTDINMKTEERMCPVDGNWLSWSLWSGCSEAKDLNETRHRNCSTPLHGGKNCSTTNFESEEQICQGIKSSSPAYSDQYGLDNLKTKSSECEKHGSNYLLAPDDVTGFSFTVVLADQSFIEKIELINTYNGDKRDRGTKNIKVEISSDENDYETVLETTLEDRRQEECLAPLEQHDVKKTGRYIKVTLVDFYELGSGLHYFNVVHKTPDEDSTQ